MPYIPQEKRNELMEWDELFRGVGEPGTLNYIITRLILEYYDLRGDGLSYAAINEAIGVLECVKLELYRRIASPYEDEKLAENGDV